MVFVCITHSTEKINFPGCFEVIAVELLLLTGRLLCGDEYVGRGGTGGGSAAGGIAPGRSL